MLHAQDPAPFFEALYEDTYADTLRYLTRRCADPAQLPDLMQEVYAEVYAVLLEKGGGYLRDPAEFVRHVAKAKLRRFYTLRQRLGTLIPLQRTAQDGELYDEPDLQQADQPPLPEQLVEDKLLAAEIAARLKTFPPDVQRIFVCVYALDMTLRQTAALLGMKESTVKAKLYRTLAKLRELYRKDGVSE